MWTESALDRAEVRLRHNQATKNLDEAWMVDRTALGESVVSQAEDDGRLPALGQHVAAIQRSRPGTTAAENDV